MDKMTTQCSYCDEQVVANRVQQTDAMSDYICAECGEFVLIEGNARREQLRRNESERIVNRVKKYADHLDDRGGPEPNPSILEIRDELTSIIEHIDSIETKIQEETKLDQNHD